MSVEGKGESYYLHKSIRHIRHRNSKEAGLEVVLEKVCHWYPCTRFVDGFG